MADIWQQIALQSGQLTYEVQTTCNGHFRLESYITCRSNDKTKIWHLVPGKIWRQLTISNSSSLDYFGRHQKIDDGSVLKNHNWTLP